MNRIPNSLGKRIISRSAYHVNDASVMWRANRDFLRVVLASKIYRSTHGGHLPSTVSEFLPYLKTWPVDPFDGKPMRYSSTKQMVYCVGKNLVDDGGAISLSLDGKDFGISLK